MTTQQVLVSRLDQRRESLLHDRNKIDEEIGLIDEMLGGSRCSDVLTKVRRNRANETAQPDEARVLREIDDANVLAAVSCLDLAGMSVWSAAVAVLKEVNQPMQLPQLAMAVQRAGKRFGGTSAPKSLAAHISQKPDALQQKKGWVYLSEWGEPVQ